MPADNRPLVNLTIPKQAFSMHFRFTANRAVFLFSLYVAVVFNIGYWRSVFQTGDWLLILTMPLFLVAAMNLIMQLLFWPKLHRLTIPLLLLAGAGASFAVMTQNIFFNADMIQNLLQTNPAEAGAWLSWKFMLWVALTGVLPAVLYARYGKIRHTAKWYKALGWRVLSAAASLAVIGALAATSYSHYASFFRNHSKISHQITPTNLIGAGIKTAHSAYDANRPFEIIGNDAKRNAAPHDRKRLLVLVAGETTRAQNWGLNPGAPDTTPELKQTAGVINYPDVSSCGTATAVSLPCMFSNMNRNDYDGSRAKHRENVMDVLQRSGLYASWRENDGGCKGVCDRVKHINIGDIAQAGQCGDDGCFDMALLNGLEEEIRTMKGDGIIVLHTIGSHGPAYYKRYTPEFKAFQPTCDTNQLQDCSTAALQNTYNNTIRYIDHMLAATIKLLDRQTDTDSALWYVSDHGESLGENGIYLHGTPYAVAPKTQTQVPMIFWAKQGWYQSSGVSAACLKNNAGRSYSHDNLFHSLLGVFDVQTAEYRKEQDIFATCRA